jgi:hypothetical protein
MGNRTPVGTRQRESGIHIEAIHLGIFDQLVISRTQADHQTKQGERCGDGKPKQDGLSGACAKGLTRPKESTSSKTLTQAQRRLQNPWTPTSSDSSSAALFVFFVCLDKFQLVWLSKRLKSCSPVCDRQRAGKNGCSWAKSGNDK